MDGMAHVAHIFMSGGLVMYPLLILSLISLAIGVERWQYFRINTKNGKQTYHGIYQFAKKENWEKAMEVCKKNPIALSRIIENGIKYSECEAQMKTAFEEQMTIETSAARKGLDYLSAIVTIAPLLGLLGTVTGMISTFSVLDTGANAATAITGGIGEALIATATGLCVAIIAFAIYTFFDHRIESLTATTENLCVVVLNSMKIKWYTRKYGEVVAAAKIKEEQAAQAKGEGDKKPAGKCPVMHAGSEG